MKFKSIEDFTEQDCLNFLANDADNKMAENVRTRLRQIRTERQANIKKAEFEKSQKILELERKMHWIDIDQFLEKCKYRNRRGVITLFSILLLLGLFCLSVSLYFDNTTHYMYSGRCYEQMQHTSGIEHVWLKIEFMRPNPPYEYKDGEYIYETGFYHYRVRDEGWAISICTSIFSLLFIFIFSAFHSPLVDKIYNIEDKDKKERIRAIEDKNGKKGLCRTGFTRIKTLLPIDYDAIFQVSPTAYMCSKDRKFGLYNTELRKMVLPIIYDRIVSCDDNTITLEKGSDLFPFSYKGYRIIN